MEPLISLRNVGLSYKVRRGLWARQEVWALKDISFDLYRGETLGVVGSNGMGKTTLLQVLAGILAPDRGTITSTECRSTLLSLALGFAPNLSGRENVFLSGMMMGMMREQISERFDAIVDFAELHDSIDWPVRTYSSGMRMRLGFAVAVEAQGDVLLIDEVLSVGDSKFKEKSRAVLEQMIASDRTVVIVSHSGPTVRSLCDRAVWVHEGRSVLEGPVEGVMEAYDAHTKSAGEG